MRKWLVDLFSDTKTRPCAAMRSAMAAAEVGDEQQHEDPTVASLNARMCEMLDMQAAIFVPSGTMANVIAILVQCGRGEEILAEASAHVLHLETGGAAGLAGAVVTPVVGTRGLLSASDFEKALRMPRRNAPRPRMVWIEQTTNLGGGAVWDILELKRISDWANEHRLVLHIDGARLFNAAIASGIDISAYGAVAASVCVDFSKGLGAPFGAVLAGSKAFIEEAARFKHMLGGGMRQAGIMAAACLYALDNNIERLHEDHLCARLLADQLQEIDGIGLESVPETNILMLDVFASGLTAPMIAHRLAKMDIRVGTFGEHRLRIVTHKDLPKDAVAQTIRGFRNVLSA